MIQIGMIGLSEGNGHPYSFSAIFNGYDEVGMIESGWPNIHAYLRARDKSDFGIYEAKVTHVWTQDICESHKIANASKIANVVENYIDMIDQVDAVIIGRDDWYTHKELASPFLEAGKFVFIDKPLSLDMDELSYFKPFLDKAQLMTCSGIRYSPELDTLKRDLSEFGRIKLIKGTVVKNWEKYSIHMLEGIFSVIPFEPINIKKNSCLHESFTIETKEGFLVEINCLGDQAPLALRIEFYSETNYYRADCLDAFSAFKRTMQNFILMIQTSHQPILPAHTLNLLNIIAEGSRL
jgi:hypothetical protein